MTGKKSTLYEQLIERQKGAHLSGYHYESCWFAHAIFEDRTSSIMANSADGTGSKMFISDKIAEIEGRRNATVAKVINGKPVRKNGRKVKKPKWPNLQTLEEATISGLKDWVTDRNTLVHKLAIGKITMSEADKIAKKQSLEGLDLTREICSAARRVKKYSLLD
ncbi:hypothetical protein [Parasphingorhabdus sp.]|uniref:hypothetical protein n=1 Tax=Parasphingorhabdus sp. TaxID=2709688 RepID=UPI003A931C17